MHLLALALTLLLPHHGTLVPGKSLGGLRLGMTQTQVKAAWGTAFGRCHGCEEETWYFTYRRFQPEGAAVRFRNGRLDAVWTLWEPTGWRTGGLLLGTPSQRITERFGVLVVIACGSYTAYVRNDQHATTAFYVYDNKLWGFGLSRRGASPCY